MKMALVGALALVSSTAHAQGAHIAPEDIGELHNAGLDYLITRIDPDRGRIQALRDLRVGTVDYLCDEVVPGGGPSCESDTAVRIVEHDRRGLPVPGAFLATLDPTSPEVVTLTALDRLIGELFSHRIDVAAFQASVDELAATADDPHLGRDARDLIAVGISIGSSSAVYWYEVQRDPTNAWQAVAAWGSGGPDGNRESWEDVVRTDVAAGIASWNDNNSQLDVLRDAILASAEAHGFDY